jgi:hypothetical protein
VGIITTPAYVRELRFVIGEQVETNIIWRKYKEAAHMAAEKDPISQRSLEISPIWTTLINDEVSKLQ